MKDKRTYKYPIGKPVYYFNYNQQCISTGKIYKWNTSTVGEVYLIEPDPDEVSERDIRDHERLKKIRKNFHGEDYKEPIQHIADEKFVRPQTKRGAKGIIREVKAFLDRRQRSELSYYQSATRRYNEAMNRIEWFEYREA